MAIGLDRFANVDDASVHNCRHIEGGGITIIMSCSA